MKVYDAAQTYVRAGLSVVPVQGKRVVVPWKEYQSRLADNSELWEWFHEKEGANLGIVTGEVSGSLLVVDWDDLDAYADWALEYPELSDTVKAETGAGGRHVYYHVANGDGLSTQPFTWNGAHAGEIRFNGGQVVAPPSIHPETGKPYRWLTGKDIPIRQIESLSDIGIDVCGPGRGGRNLSSWANQSPVATPSKLK